MTIEKLAFGRTGHESTRTLFGAAALGSVDQSTADRTLDVLLQYGVNHIDTAASYGDSELRIAPWLKRHRKDFFLATKTGQRGAKPAREELHRSLDRLGVDHVDLWQVHNLADPIDWDTALSPGGVIEAAQEAKQQGLVRFIGVTGHGSQIAANHRRSLERFDFDSVLLPYNYITMQLPYYAENFEALVATCRERNVAVQTIKSIAMRPWRGRERTHTTWYEPLESQADIDVAVWWVLGRPGVFLNTVGDVNLLPKMLDAARRFEKRPSDEQMQELMRRGAQEPLFV
ncbi:MAG TPA: aldo/keto reductase [Candidatus Dormibacteraeota bacterium]|nr:aldo/keto reductase [Candidatus Dormibacteraeota bacterium]